jgi:hypothetical protein
VNTEVTQPEQAIETIETQVGELRDRLDAHDRDLRAIDGELAGFSVQREQHALLETICGSLDRLGELGAAELFWGERADGGAAFVRDVRERSSAFRAQLAAIEARRREVIDRIRRDQETLAFLEDDLYDAQQAEERRRLEWLVERELDGIVEQPAVMPWTKGGDDDRRLRKALSTTFLVCLVFALILPFVDLPIIKRSDVVEVPERLARLVQQQIRAKLPPEPPREEIVPEQKPPEPEPPKPTEEAKPPEPTEALAQEPARQPEPPRGKPQAAPTPPKPAGILAFREQLSNLAVNRPSAKLGASARISGAGAEAVGRTERSMVTKQGPGSSGGINLAQLSRDVGGGGGGGQMEGVQIGKATSSIGGIAGTDRPLSGGPGSSRTDEEIQIVFDRHKSALYRIYNRELRNDPTLQGQMVLKLTIEPDGSVSLCQLQASDMNAPQLSQQVVDRVKTFDFGAKDGIPAITIFYPIDFLPAA